MSQKCSYILKFKSILLIHFILIVVRDLLPYEAG